MAEVVEERVESLAQKAEFVIREFDDVHGQETNATGSAATGSRAPGISSGS